jgi:hypothetical protein
MILEIKVKSEAARDAALDNLARFLKRTETGWSSRGYDSQTGARVTDRGTNTIAIMITSKEGRAFYFGARQLF